MQSKFAKIAAAAAALACVAFSANANAACKSACDQGKSRHHDANRPGRLSVVMADPEEDGGKQDCLGGHDRVAQVRE